MKLVQVWVLLLAATVLTSTVAAQSPEMSAVASQMAKTLAKKKQKSVIVFDFWGPGQDLTALGQTLAQAFSTALTSPGASYQVLDRSKIAGARKAHALSLSTTHDREIDNWLAQDLGAKVVIMGELSVVDDRLVIQITSYSTKDQKSVAGFKLTSPMTNDLRTLMSQTVQTALPVADLNMRMASAEGYSYPKCLYCPQAEYDQRAVDQRLEVTVTLEAIIGINGKAQDIKVLKGLPYGLTQKAIEAVGRWTFKPAMKPEGGPVAVRQVIEVTFHLY